MKKRKSQDEAILEDYEKGRLESVSPSKAELKNTKRRPGRDLNPLDLLLLLRTVRSCKILLSCKP